MLEIIESTLKPKPTSTFCDQTNPNQYVKSCVGVGKISRIEKPNHNRFKIILTDFQPIFQKYPMDFICLDPKNWNRISKT